ncbi:MAG: hypothetical protein EZS28_034230 [Streblomastix strix]|uniref:Uncharacterized protein n=1 Tax=Streblomastix strix TaxID=222440 RepID=A0A5J4UJ59_9EUKA|nr:MAG: hypothetical protein EZS28_034230 [Streblomastix strix]
MFDFTAEAFWQLGKVTFGGLLYAICVVIIMNITINSTSVKRTNQNLSLMANSAAVAVPSVTVMVSVISLVKIKFTNTAESGYIAVQKTAIVQKGMLAIAIGVVVIATIITAVTKLIASTISEVYYSVNSLSFQEKQSITSYWAKQITVGMPLYSNYYVSSFLEITSTITTTIITTTGAPTSAAAQSTAQPNQASSAQMNQASVESTGADLLGIIDLDLTISNCQKSLEMIIGALVVWRGVSCLGRLGSGSGVVCLIGAVVWWSVGLGAYYLV